MANRPRLLGRPALSGQPVRPRPREHDDRRERLAWRKWYGLARWKAIRAAQLAAEPLCRMCDGEGRIEPATVCDHVTPHRGDEYKFWHGPFQSLCKWHHDRDKQRDEAARR